MKRYLQIITILFLISSAWGQALAAGICPRVVQGRDCCINSAVAPHDHKLMGQAEMMPMSGMDGVERSQPSPAAKNVSSSLALPVEACAHCMAHSGLIAPGWGKARITNESRQDLVSLEPQASAISLLPPAIFTSKVPVNSGAPPRQSAPRYILLSLLLI